MDETCMDWNQVKGYYMFEIKQLTKMTLFSNEHNSKKLHKSAFSIKFLLEDFLNEQKSQQLDLSLGVVYHIRTVHNQTNKNC